MGSENRLTMLEQLTEKGEADSFAWYALANEYLSFERNDDALKAFQTLRGKDPDYVPMYLICGQMLLNMGRANEARDWLETGMMKAQEKGESHAMSELEQALDKVPPPPSLV
jgi:predicted Zn-dependent protease